MAVIAAVCTLGGTATGQNPCTFEYIDLKVTPARLPDVVAARTDRLNRATSQLSSVDFYIGGFQAFDELPFGMQPYFGGEAVYRVLITRPTLVTMRDKTNYNTDARFNAFVLSNPLIVPSESCTGVSRDRVYTLGGDNEGTTRTFEPGEYLIVIDGTGPELRLATFDIELDFAYPAVPDSTYLGVLDDVSFIDARQSPSAVDVATWYTGRSMVGDLRGTTNGEQFAPGLSQVFGQPGRINFAVYAGDAAFDEGFGVTPRTPNAGGPFRLSLTDGVEEVASVTGTLAPGELRFYEYVTRRGLSDPVRAGPSNEPVRISASGTNSPAGEEPGDIVVFNRFGSPVRSTLGGNGELSLFLAPGLYHAAASTAIREINPEDSLTHIVSFNSVSDTADVNITVNGVTKTATKTYQPGQSRELPAVFADIVVEPGSAFEFGRRYRSDDPFSISTAGTPFDTKMALLDDVGNVVLENDDANIFDNSSLLADLELEPGQYFVQVAPFDADFPGTVFEVERGSFTPSDPTFSLSVGDQFVLGGLPLDPPLNLGGAPGPGYARFFVQPEPKARFNAVADTSQFTNIRVVDTSGPREFGTTPLGLRVQLIDGNGFEIDTITTKAALPIDEASFSNLALTSGQYFVVVNTIGHSARLNDDTFAHGTETLPALCGEPHSFDLIINGKVKSIAIEPCRVAYFPFFVTPQAFGHLGVVAPPGETFSLSAAGDGFDTDIAAWNLETGWVDAIGAGSVSTFTPSAGLTDGEYLFAVTSDATFRDDFIIDGEPSPAGGDAVLAVNGSVRRVATVFAGDALRPPTPVFLRFTVATTGRTDGDYNLSGDSNYFDLVRHLDLIAESSTAADVAPPFGTVNEADVLETVQRIEAN
ncbi:MAG: hypothetical protein AAF747_04360 [Planctomycetota bacterium]